jgi:hypothetical protein
VCLVAICRELHPVRQLPAKIVHEHQGELGIATADLIGHQQLAIGIAVAVHVQQSPAVGSRAR